jgi:preprotein translocase subunit SecE
MAVAEVTESAKKKMDKSDNGDSGRSSKVSSAPAGGPVWPVRKWTELITFFTEVRTELKKVTWPGRQEVYSTTIVIIATTIFFGCYLWLVDLGCTKVLAQMLRQK